ncbi:cytoplasmic dynein 1 heavy chain 1 [Orycteropus afer afer]|uniref:Dynein heavy chain, cytoplasmic n=1 Tax=Orycteropus afer afer TaxID=1230840 RepID=A0A8B7AY78_ORYAF|nr:cytoplasmic dynein 1 heavy chain 1 [Orycteropus afer afer]
MSEPGGGGGGGGEDSSAGLEVSAVQNVADVSVLQKHLRKLVPLLLEDGGEAPAALEAALEEKSALEHMRKFLSDPQVHTVLVERSTLKEDVGDEGEEEKEFISYNINIDIHYGVKSNSLAFIKRTPVIDADKPVSSQLRVLTLSEDSPYETLHSFICNAVAPFFKSYIRESGKADRDGDKMAPSVEKKIAELEMGLLHLQQNIEIPEISLPIHPIITNVAKQCYERGEKPKVTDFGEKVEDPTFLNQLQSGVNRWIREIQKVTKLDRDPASGTALQEISFWLNLERALYRIQEKRESPEVLLTLDILKHGKRFHATVSFDTDTGLKQALETVNDYNPLMKDFPLNDLLSATELDKIRQALVAIFTHLRKIRNTKYPIQRALRLVEAISRDLSSQLLKVLGTRKLMHVAYEEFEKVMVACFEVFQTWDDEYEKLQVLLRDIVKRKREENLKMVWRINPAHRKLQARLDQMRKFRRQHEQLRAVIVRVLRPQVTAVAQQNQGEVPEPQDMKVAEVLFDAADANAIEEVNLAYENVKEVDGLDVSKEGTEAWEAAMKRYDERIDRVETRITARLRDQLGTAKNANEMFRIFSRFNALFVRPHIRGAIREYQTQLIQRVKDDIGSLHDKFKVQYPQSQACKMSHVRDLPPVSGSIIWAKQIDRQLTAYMKRVEDVLGKGWENHVEGQKLKQDGDSFRMKLNTQEIFDDWARKVQQRNLGVSGRIFTIESARVRGRTGNVLKLKVNFLPEIITLSKEVRNLKWLGFRVPLAIVNKAHQANQLYPFAISLIESVRTYERTCEKVEERNTISLLVAGLKKEVQALIAEGVALVWESYKLDPYVQRLAETVFNFQEKVDDLLIIEEKIDLEVRSLETCMYDHRTFSEILNRVQKAVDDLNLHSYSNLPIWVNKLDMEIERILGVRLQAGLRAWTQVLLGQAEDKAEVDMDTDAPQVSHKPGGEPKIKNVVHELRITNQVIYLNPPIEECRYKLYQEMFAWKMVILSLPRIQSQRYQVGVHYELTEEEKFYRNALTRMPDGPMALEESYSAVMGIVTEVEQYVKVWLQYQCLWDMQAENIYNRLGEDLNKWQALLVQIRKARGTFDNAETKKEFGPVVIDYGKVQSKVNLKYDSWHKEVLSKFGQMLGSNMTEFHSQISKSRQELEQHSVDTASTSDAVTFITYVQSLKRKIKQFEKQVEGNLRPEEALQALTIYEGKFGRLKDDREKCAKAKEALELTDTGLLSGSEERVQVALEELQDLKGVWSELSKVWEQIDQMKEQPWVSVQPRKLRQNLDGLLNQLKNFPARLRQYASYEFVQRLLKGYMKVNMLVIELKSEALKDRHWKQLMKRLHVNWVVSELTLGQIWDVDLQKNEAVVKDVLLVAQGEMALEEFLKQVMDVLNIQGVQRSLERLADLLGKIQKALGEYLERERSSFPRADSVLMEQPPLRRRKLEHLITELVHQRDVTRSLMKSKVDNPKSFEWLSQMRFYFDPKQTDVLQQLSIQMANAKFNYGFEYLGVQDKLVQTPLTDRCYLTMTQALEARLGGSPFGPAGTGKTESVKALGHQLGRFVLVFNCDETFDFQAMGRIFVGLCQVGAWGCFDEFNRLEERMLSAVSQQVQCIQEALREHSNPNYDKTSAPITCELLNKQVKVSPDMAIFITMNPGYAGRSNLPDNLKKLFRSLAMTKPDRQLIAQVMLYSQGFRTAEVLANKIVPFFKLCDEQLSSQSHYDFGLRALKSVLVSAGNVKRERIQKIKREKEERGEAVDEGEIAENLPEQEILIQSVCETMVPKLVAEDIPLLFSLLSDVFPGVQYHRGEMTALREELRKVCQEMYLTYGDGEEVGGMWVEKVLQLYQITQINHGLMMVGPSGSGKSMAWRVLLKALERLEGVEGVAHIIDPKAISKDHLYGTLDPNTREWTDGLFTHVLRKIIDNVRGELQKRQWIVFDGDVDPEWVENLNSVLDDNKLLTLPNGERLSLPPNVRIMFEVQDLKYATLATVSRCGMVWFSEDVLSTDMIFNNFLARLRSIPLDEGEDEAQRLRKGKEDEGEEAASPMLQIQRDAATIMQPYFTSNGLVTKALEHAFKLEHIMDLTRLRCLGSLFSMLHQACRNVAQYNANHPDFPMQVEQLERYVQRYLVYAILWSLSGDSRLKMRAELGEYIRRITTVPLPTAPNVPIIDYEVSISGEWSPWQSKVPQIEVETHKVAAPDVVVPTLDTVRHEALLYTWLAEHKPLVLCGPPGSGKTMTLFSALRALPDMEVVGLNFSSATTPELLLKTFDHYCEYRRTPNGVVLAPVQLGKWLVLFCDEINLPDMDKYGTQRVISFIRQMVEHGGFYRTSDQTWVKLERIQFVGACNPPTDPGRKPLSHRFLRHVPVVYVDYPGPASLTQIYGTFNRAMLRLIPSLRTYAEPLTAAMVEFYTMSQERFTQDTQPHYIYSPREMTRWVRGIFEALRPLETLPVEGLIRIWAHEALRLFQDRLVEDEERRWTDENIDMVALKHFPNIDKEKAMSRPILYSNWLSKDYIPVDQEELRDYVKARLKVFYEEELDVPLVLFNEVLDHVLRIDRIFRQPQGHLLLIGVSGAGKTTLSRFVAWMNGLSVYQIKVHRKYTGEDFDEDLRTVLRRSGCKNEKIAFIMDESNVLDSGFLERMNTLLANGEVPGLFEGDEYATLMTQCKEGAQKEGLMLDSHEELYKWFTSQVIRNLHVVFTMNPSSEGLKDRAATSPALFNRCVLNWFGDWSTEALYQVGKEFTSKMDLEKPNYVVPDYMPVVYDKLPQPPSHREAIVNSCVFVHQTLHQANARLAKRGGRTMAITPRHYLDFINHYANLFNEKRSELEEQQMHLNVGLRKIKETVDQVMSQEIQEQLHKQQEVIADKQMSVKEDLDKVEPAVIEAQNAVKSIKKQHLVEVRSMANPPAAVKLALESICLLLGESTTDWKQIRSVIMRENFIPTIVNFSAEEIRYPLIIDPSGQATEFIMNEYKDRKITRTSFLDDAFRKNLESALRFGNPLLVQDVESYDPVLNPVLNREVRRTGGRVLITLGDQDIDLSPSFVIFLSTRDPTVEFPPDLCSRVTFVNFTVTRSSLQSQCLNEVLKAERPDVDEKRSDLLKLQGEFQLRLRQLEKSLLQALNEVKGRILDDDTIITTLENLKREAAEVTRKVEETDIVMQEVETVSQQYLPLSTACSSIYFTMESLKQIHFLYQYSLQFFLDIYHNVLYENPNLKGITDHTQRLSIITKDLFQVAFNRVARGMLHQDHITFAMLLARIKLKGTIGEPAYDAEFQHFLRGKEMVLSAGSTPKIAGLTIEQAEAAMRLSCLPAFKDLIGKVQADEQFGIWLDSSSPEQTVPYLWSEDAPATPIGQAIHRLLLIQAFRPDRLLAMAHTFVSTNLGESFMSIMEQPLDLTHIVDTEVKPNTPVLMCSVPGYDASGHVEDLAAEQNTQITSIAIGSAEGFNQADKAINTAVKSGRWVMLKNVHLAPGWLMQLEKKLHSLQPHACFRLFLTMEINPKVPVNLLRAGRIFVFEPPPGVKANMLRTFSSIPVSRICKSPNERARLYFLLAWFHAIIQERLRYAPLGWSKKYEFGESDLRSACDTVDTWLDDTAKGRQNISPDKIPWSALKTLMAQSIYGGRVDNEFDQRLLNTFLERLFTTRSFDSEFKLACKVDGHKDIQMPDGIRREEFVQWVELLPDTQTPSWLGLPNNAERVLLTTQGVDMISKMLKMQMLEDEDDLAYAEAEKKTRTDSTSDGRPTWMRTLHTTASNWLQLIPQTLTHLKRTVENIKDPLFRFFEREVKMGAKLLQDVRQDLADVVQVCEGKKKQTNYLRTLINELVKGILPRSWSHYTVPAGMTVIQWVSDFSERVKQLQSISLAAASGGAKELKNIHVCLGGLFVPEAYITATRQYVAQANSWSLEELCLEVNVTTSQSATLDACSFGVTGLKLQGATCSNNKLSLSNAISTVLPLTQLRWVKQTNTEKKTSAVTLPVYLNFTRADLIFTVDFEIATKEDPRSFYERGVAVLCTE